WHRSFLVMRRAAGITLKEWVGLHEGDAARTGKMAETLKALFARMAAFRIGHGDLKATNLLVDEHDAVSFIDLDATTCLSPSSRWADIRARDKRIFHGNWKAFPRAQEAFSGVFES